MMLDLVPEMITWLEADTEVVVEGFSVFGLRIPQDSETPLVLVTMVSQTPSTAPQTGWWRSLLALDFHSEEPGISREVAYHVATQAPKFAGIHGAAVVTDSQVVSNESIVDDGWTPTRFRQVVTVEVTAREP
jgi:hypothetical protein